MTTPYDTTPDRDGSDANKPLIVWPVGRLFTYLAAWWLGVGLAWLIPLTGRMTGWRLYPSPWSDTGARIGDTGGFYLGVLLLLVSIIMVPLILIAMLRWSKRIDAKPRFWLTPAVICILMLGMGPVDRLFRGLEHPLYTGLALSITVAITFICLVRACAHHPAKPGRGRLSGRRVR